MLVPHVKPRSFLNGVMLASEADLENRCLHDLTQEGLDVACRHRLRVCLLECDSGQSI